MFVKSLKMYLNLVLTTPEAMAFKRTELLEDGAGCIRAARPIRVTGMADDADETILGDRTSRPAAMVVGEKKRFRLAVMLVVGIGKGARPWPSVLSRCGSSGLLE